MQHLLGTRSTQKAPADPRRAAATLWITAGAGCSAWASRGPGRQYWPPEVAAQHTPVLNVLTAVTPARCHLHTQWKQAWSSRSPTEDINRTGPGQTLEHCTCYLPQEMARMQEPSHTPSAVTPITLSLQAIMSLRHIYPWSPCADPRDLLLPVSQEELLLDAKAIGHPDTRRHPCSAAADNGAVGACAKAPSLSKQDLQIWSVLTREKALPAENQAVT